jgi:hypothetical protein
MESLTVLTYVVTLNNLKANQHPHQLIPSNDNSPQFMVIMIQEMIL